MQVPEPRAQRPEESARPGQTRSLEPRGPKAESCEQQLPRHDEPLRSRSPGRPHRRRTRCSDVPPRRGGREGRASTARFTSSHPLDCEFRDSVQHSARHSGSLWDPTHTATLGFTPVNHISPTQTIVNSNSTATSSQASHNPSQSSQLGQQSLQSITQPSQTCHSTLHSPATLVISLETRITATQASHSCYLSQNSA